MYSMRRRLFASCGIVFSVALVAAVLVAEASAAKRPKRQVAYLSTAWNLSGKAKGNIKRVGKFTDVATLQLFFGPLDLVDDVGAVVFSLGAGQFLINDADAGRFLTGSFVDNGKGKATLTPDIGELREFLTETFEEIFADVALDIETLSILKLTTTTKAKARDTGDTIKLKFSTKFFGTGTAEGEDGEGKGSLSYSANGSFVPLLE